MKEIMFARCQKTNTLQYWGPGSTIYHICKGCGEHTSYDTPKHYGFFCFPLSRKTKETWNTYHDRAFAIVSKNPEKYRI